MFQNRKSGILLHPTSFPSAFAIGDLGEAAHTFIEKCNEANQTLWQILPLCPVDHSGSPYQSASAFAGEPLLISPTCLVADGLLLQEEVDHAAVFDGHFTDHSAACSIKFPLFQKAYARFQSQPLPSEYEAFCTENAFWLEDYALFMAIKAYLIEQRQDNKEDRSAFLEEWTEALPEETLLAYYDNACWCTFPTPLRKRTAAAVKKYTALLKEEILWHCFLQFLFHKQWHALKTFAHENNVSIIGDAPIFVAYDSADVWANQKLFLLDTKGCPLSVAGVPPDYFSETGQLWGNPLYHWKQHQKTGYAWWISRIKKALQDVDYLRIDHFRAFETYWEIPVDAPDARNGKWVAGPGIDFFNALSNALGKLPLIAEDLGIITDEVRALRESVGLPGMRILQFAFGNDKNNAYLPHAYDKNTLVYTGTHDNNTTQGWYQQATEEEKDHYRRYLNVSGESPAWDLIRLAFSSPAVMAIIPLQDVLNLGEDYRMNLPGTTTKNWSFAFSWDMWQQSQIETLSYLSTLFARNT